MSDDWGEPQTSGTHDLETQGPVAGIYTGFKEVSGTFGISQLHSFTTDNGPVSVWGKAHLDRLLSGRVGELVKVEMLLDANGKPKMMALPQGRSMVEYRLYSKGKQDRPVVPDSPLPAPVVEESSGKAEADTIRAQRVAMAMKDASIDDDMRGDLIYWYTMGESRSAKDLTEKQADGLYKLIDKIRRGVFFVRYDEDGKLYLSDGKGAKVNA